MKKALWRLKYSKIELLPFAVIKRGRVAAFEIVRHGSPLSNAKDDLS